MRHAREDYNRIQDPADLIPADEPVFLLRAQDKLAPGAIEWWASQLERAGGSREMITAARSQAARMRAWAHRKIPDMPPEPPMVPRIEAYNPESEGGRT